uniref:Uncharacterized protein n=1 Tax=Myoviridae sp. ctIty1 TaxID=2827673 RepID=A0A8S5TGW7_9CAUD|nr:MAG TPA: hypothetical protein [Myoviridae sp. ctIty1]
MISLKAMKIIYKLLLKIIMIIMEVFTYVNH